MKQGKTVVLILFNVSKINISFSHSLHVSILVKVGILADIDDLEDYEGFEDNEDGDNIVQDLYPLQADRSPFIRKSVKPIIWNKCK